MEFLLPLILDSWTRLCLLVEGFEGPSDWRGLRLWVSFCHKFCNLYNLLCDYLHTLLRRIFPAIYATIWGLELSTQYEESMQNDFVWFSPRNVETVKCLFVFFGFSIFTCACKRHFRLKVFLFFSVDLKYTKKNGI